MISFSNEYRGYKVKVSNPGTGVRGYSFTARDLDEAHQALDHYYGKNHGEGREDCPTCRLVAKEDLT